MRLGKKVGSCAFAVLMLGVVLTGPRRMRMKRSTRMPAWQPQWADWSPPQTVEEAITLQEALAELVAGCGTEAEAETEGAEEGLSDADHEFPRTMYVTSRVPRINVRRYASTSSAIVGTLAFAAPVEVLARARGASYRGNAVWWRVGEGYVHSLLLGEAQPAPLSIPTPTPLPITAPQQQETQTISRHNSNSSHNSRAGGSSRSNSRGSSVSRSVNSGHRQRTSRRRMKRQSLPIRSNPRRGT